MKKNTKTIYNHFPLVLYLVGYMLLLGSKIILHPTVFFDWDESIYAQVGREMLRNRSFFVPLWQGMLWFDKPPIPSLFYGLIQLIPIAPEISTRLATVFLSSVVLVFIYMLSERVTKDKVVSLVTVVITSFLPIFFQRAQALNVDVFLLIGWFGYILWYERKVTSTIFLLIAVLSKSLLGYFPPLLMVCYYTYLYIRKQLDVKKLFEQIKQISFQCILASVWFAGMILVYRYPFIKYQFIDSHFKRVTSSIEQHFGQRSFYLTVLVDQLKLLLVPSFVSVGYLIYVFFKNKKQQFSSFLSLFFVPWFVFLNLTKTKIEWYIYPVLPQFAFLASYPLSFIKKHNVIQMICAAFILGFFFTKVTPINTLLTVPFSSEEDHHRIAYAAKNNHCSSLYVLVGDTTRTSYATLHSMDLTIATTTWWGNHPSIAYYADTKTTYIYTINEMKSKIRELKKNQCVIVEKNDISHFKNEIPDPVLNGENKTYIIMQK